MEELQISHVGDRLFQGMEVDHVTGEYRFDVFPVKGKGEHIVSII